MNEYEIKQQARRERYESRAEKARQASDNACKVSREATAAIVIGQPILVGHHSESRHRAALVRSDRAMRKACDESDKANHYAAKAAAVGTAGVSSDDPDAIAKLRVDLEAREALQLRMKAANKVIRAGKTPEAREAGLVGLGYSQAKALDLLAPDFANRVGFPAYALTNNNASIARIKKRIDELEASQVRENVEVECSGYSYKEDADENRVMFVFEGKPAEPVRAVLKAHAFKWSPSRGAWVRQLTAAGVYAGERARAALDALEKSN